MRRIEEGAEKWALRDLRRDEETSVQKNSKYQHFSPPNVIRCAPMSSNPSSSPNSSVSSPAALYTPVTIGKWMLTRVEFHLVLRSVEDVRFDEIW